jgi:hypothetical protein
VANRAQCGEAAGAFASAAPSRQAGAGLVRAALGRLTQAAPDPQCSTVVVQCSTVVVSQPRVRGIRD